jgi:hypothetical protein
MVILEGRSVIISFIIHVKCPGAHSVLVVLLVGEFVLGTGRHGCKLKWALSKEIIRSDSRITRGEVVGQRRWN